MRPKTLLTILTISRRDLIRLTIRIVGISVPGGFDPSSGEDRGLAHVISAVAAALHGPDLGTGGFRAEDFGADGPCEGGTSTATVPASSSAVFIQDGQLITFLELHHAPQEKD